MMYVLYAALGALLGASVSCFIIAILDAYPARRRGRQG